MSYEEIKAYMLKCDECGEFLKGEYDSVLFCRTTESLDAYAAEDGYEPWREEDGLHECGACIDNRICDVCGEEFPKDEIIVFEKCRYCQTCLDEHKQEIE